MLILPCFIYNRVNNTSSLRLVNPKTNLKHEINVFGFNVQFFLKFRQRRVSYITIEDLDKF